MIRARALPMSEPSAASAPSVAPARIVRLLGIGAGLLIFVLVGGMLLGAALTLGATPRDIWVDLPNGGEDVPPDAELRATVAGWRANLGEARLYETVAGPDGRPGAEREVPLLTDVLRATWQPKGTEVALRPAGGQLQPDGAYRLVVRGTALTLPGTSGVLEREARFATVRSPRAQVPLAPVRLKWGEPLRIAWDAPIDEFRVDVSPAATLKTWIEPGDRRQAFVAIQDPKDGTPYRLTIAGARGTNGVAARQPADVQVAYPPRPRLLDAEQARTIEDGKPLVMTWSTPIDRLKYEVDPPVPTTWQADRRDPSTVELRFDGLAQGATYSVNVTEAVSREGAPFDGPAAIELSTPAALVVEDLDWGEDGPRASIKTQPTLIFSQPVRDRRLAQAAISLDPPIAGRWDWVDDRHIRFSPLRPLPYDTELTFKVKAGRDGARSVAGSYVEDPAAFSFTTETDKIIDVDVTRQVMQLVQQGRTVRTLTVATGVPGADTPIGEFLVQYKMPVARFRGVNVGGSRYDIPDVKWVLAFMGDYTIHGAYWRAAFGAPGSNGCVSLADADAKAVYDWAPEGTRIKIHY